LKLKGLFSDKLYFKFYSTPPIWVNEEYEPAQHIVFVTNTMVGGILLTINFLLHLAPNSITQNDIRCLLRFPGRIYKLIKFLPTSTCSILWKPFPKASTSFITLQIGYLPLMSKASWSYWSQDSQEISFMNPTGQQFHGSNNTRLAKRSSAKTSANSSPDQSVKKKVLLLTILCRFKRHHHKASIPT